MEILFKGLIGIFIIIILGLVIRTLRAGKEILREKSIDEPKKIKYLYDKFLPLKGQIDKELNKEIINIIVYPPKNLDGYWIVKKFIKKDWDPFDTVGEAIEIYSENNERIELEMSNSIQYWKCEKCKEDNETTFKICWNCQEEL
jgi:hypothetical protein